MPGALSDAANHYIQAFRTVPLSELSAKLYDDSLSLFSLSLTAALFFAGTVQSRHTNNKHS